MRWSEMVLFSSSTDERIASNRQRAGAAAFNAMTILAFMSALFIGGVAHDTTAWEILVFWSSLCYILPHFFPHNKKKNMNPFVCPTQPETDEPVMLERWMKRNVIRENVRQAIHGMLFWMILSQFILQFNKWSLTRNIVTAIVYGVGIGGVNIIISLATKKGRQSTAKRYMVQNRNDEYMRHSRNRTGWYGFLYLTGTGILLSIALVVFYPVAQLPLIIAAILLEGIITYFILSGDAAWNQQARQLFLVDDEKNKQRAHSIRIFLLAITVGWLAVAYLTGVSLKIPLFTVLLSAYFYAGYFFRFIKPAQATIPSAQ
jgi:hypothetical protein